MKKENVSLLLANAPPKMKEIGKKVISKERITREEGIFLFQNADISWIGALANYIREEKHQDNTYFNRNFHIEPTNVCVFDCTFCSYSRLYAKKEEGWELTIEQMFDRVKKYDNEPITEVHIVGGVHPKMNLYFFIDLIKLIKQHRPSLHIKAFTAVELDYMIRKAKLTIEEGLIKLKEAGLESIPGGGAEIFEPSIREKICNDKVDGTGWLSIHRKAHRLGIVSNATILYGHIENYANRIDHLLQLRDLQDETKGFQTIIPLKFRNKNNQLSHIPETTILEDLKMYAITRIFMDNVSHIKAYWPMLGRDKAQLTLQYGVDDLDGTIDDSTKIYTMAGSEEQKPQLSTQELIHLITSVGRIPVERNSFYQTIKKYDTTLNHSNESVSLK